MSKVKRIRENLENAIDAMDVSTQESQKALNQFADAIKHVNIEPKGCLITESGAYIVENGKCYRVKPVKETDKESSNA